MFSNPDRRTLLEKFVQRFLAVVDELEAGVLVLVDASYARGKSLPPRLTAGHHLLTRVRWNAVAYQPAPPPKQRRRGRPRRYGQKVRRWDLWSRHRPRFQTALSPLYGESPLILRYYAIELLWRPVAQLMRFVLVDHPTRGRVILHEHRPDPDAARVDRRLRLALQDRVGLPPGHLYPRHLGLSLLDEGDDAARTPQR